MSPFGKTCQLDCCDCNMLIKEDKDIQITDMMFYEETPMSKFYAGNICFDFDGNIHMFLLYFTGLEAFETEGAGIWVIKRK